MAGPTGEPGHVWEHTAGYPIPHALLAGAEREQGRTPRYPHGPLACTECGVPWPGTKPCTGSPA